MVVANNVSVSDDGKAARARAASGNGGGGGGGVGGGSGSGDDNWLYMSAVCYLYGLGVHQALGVPVGLMNTNWGGTAIQDWMGADALAACAKDEHRAPVQQQGRLALSSPAPAPAPPPLGVPTHLFNAMVSPLLNHTIAGVVWWQGESNGGAPVPYGCQMAALVADWRAKWHAGSGGATAADFPFGVVQLAGCPDGGDAPGLGGVAIRMFQTGGGANNTPAGHLPNALMPNTFMAVSYDLGDETSPFGAVHIRYKTDVADRLVAAGLKQAYGHADAYAGPVFAGVSAADSSAGTVTLRFTDTGAKGLALSAMNVSTAHPQTNWSGATPFEVCAAGHDCALMSRFDGWRAPASTAIGADGSSVVLGLDASSGPIAAVRFAWRAYPCQHKQCGLYAQAEHLPPPPFWVELVG